MLSAAKLKRDPQSNVGIVTLRTCRICDGRTLTIRTRMMSGAGRPEMPGILRVCICPAGGISRAAASSGGRPGQVAEWFKAHAWKVCNG